MIIIKQLLLASWGTSWSRYSSDENTGTKEEKKKAGIHGYLIDL